MAMENVIVGTNVGGQPELIDDEVGFLLNISEYGTEYKIGTVVMLYRQRPRKFSHSVCARVRKYDCESYQSS